MARTKIDYAKAYKETKKRLELKDSMNSELIGKYEKLSCEFNKAVAEGKRFREMLYEQRGVIGFLETKLEKLKDGSSV
jgi:hypothetical protein